MKVSFSHHLQDNSATNRKMNNQQAAATSQADNALKNGKQALLVPFAILYPVLESQLDKDRDMQLRTLYNRLKENKISKDGFVKQMRDLVGDHMLKLAVAKLQEQAPRSSQVAPKQVARNVQVSAQQQHMNSSAQSLKQQPQKTQVNLQAKVDELKKEKVDLGNRLKEALSQVESFLAQKSSWDKERTALEEKVKDWRARAEKAESSISELASKLQTYEANYKAEVKEIRSIHKAELKKLQKELEEVRSKPEKSMDKVVLSFQDGYSTCSDKFAGVDVTGKLFQEYCAELDSSLFIDAL